MDIRKISIAVIVSLIFIQASCECDDPYPSPFILEVPINTITKSDTLHVGDTIWIEADFSKQVSFYNSNQSIWLDSFSFFSQIGLNEISGETESKEFNLATFSTEGKISKISNNFAFPIEYIEYTNSYRFRGGLVIGTPGLFSIAIYTIQDLLWDNVTNHPALINCRGNNRIDSEIFYINEATTENNFNNVFRKSKVDYILDLVDYEEYSQAAGYAFVVEE